MAIKRHIGIVIFAACSAISARLAIFEPKPHVATASEERWGIRQVESKDTLGVLHGFRYYIFGIGMGGLLIVAEDYLNERWKRRRAEPGGRANAG